MKCLCALAAVFCISAAFMIHDIMGHANQNYSCKDDTAWIKQEAARGWISEALK